MTVHRVTRNYFAVYKSRPIAFAQGDTVDVDGTLADWVNRDSPGCLVADDTAPVEDVPAPDDDTETEAPADSVEVPVEDVPAPTRKRGR